MRRQFAYVLLVSILGMSLLGIAGSAQAQTDPPLATETLTPPQEEVSFAQLGAAEINLMGPFERTFISFSLPSDWKMIEGAELTLSIGVSITPYVITAAGGISPQTTGTTLPAVVSGGVLTAQLNGVVLGDVPLTSEGTQTIKLPIPLEAFNTNRADGYHVLALTLNSDASCEVLNSQLDLVIRNTSSLTLPHEFVLPDTNLEKFPRPIVQGSFVPDQVLFVLPDKPSAQDLQSAVTMAAGLGNLSGRNLEVGLTSVSKLTSEQTAASHLILVGKPASMPMLADLELPLPVTLGKLVIDGGGPDDGVVQMVNSPWNEGKVILVVTGNTDAGMIKAAQAVSTGPMRTHTSQNLAIIDQVQNSLSAPLLPTDQTLADLGYDVQTFELRGLNTRSYRFSVPSGWGAAADSNFELFYGHSKLLNYERSGLVVLMNGQPIGSVRFSDLTGDQAVNQTQISIPPSVIRPGVNQLEIRASLEPIHACSPRNMRGLWVNIWPDSRLHLPINQLPIQTGVLNDLAAYPAPFALSANLADTAFVVPQNNPQTWLAALQIAAQLGDYANGSISQPAVFFADQVPASERAQYNLLIIGQPSQLPLITELNDFLPAPFATENDAANESGFQVIYRIPLNSPLGYVQLLASPWNPDKVILAVLGRQPQGLDWAVSALTETKLSSQLAGNFAVVINAQQLKSTDTRITPLTSDSQLETAPATELATPAAVSPVTAAQFTPPTWILPILAISLVLLVILVVVVFFPGSKPNRKP